MDTKELEQKIISLKQLAESHKEKYFRLLGSIEVFELYLLEAKRQETKND
jgi:hypothetical protein